MPGPFDHVTVFNGLGEAKDAPLEWTRTPSEQPYPVALGCIQPIEPKLRTAHKVERWSGLRKSAKGVLLALFGVNLCSIAYNRFSWTKPWETGTEDVDPYWYWTPIGPPFTEASMLSVRIQSDECFCSEVIKNLQIP
jgi:hypothetical protein